MLMMFLGVPLLKWGDLLRHDREEADDSAYRNGLHLIAEVGDKIAVLYKISATLGTNS